MVNMIKTTFVNNQYIMYFICSFAKQECDPFSSLLFLVGREHKCMHLFYFSTNKEKIAYLFVC